MAEVTKAFLPAEAGFGARLRAAFAAGAAVDAASGAALQELLVAVSRLACVDHLLAQVGPLARKGSALAPARLSREALSEEQERSLARFRGSLLASAANRGKCGHSEALAAVLAPVARARCSPGPLPAPFLVPSAQGSMKQGLGALRRRRPGCVLLVRRIKQLGFDAPARLEDHFSRYGRVAEVYVAHSMARRCRRQAPGRARPAALGFVVMSCGSSVAAALAMGNVHSVAGVDIEVHAFEAFGMGAGEEA